MDNEFRRLIFAIAVAMLVFVAYQYVAQKFFPAPPPASQPAAADVAERPAPRLPTTNVATTRPAEALPVVSTSAPAGPTIGANVGHGGLVPGEGKPSTRVTLGGDKEPLKVVLDPRGAALTELYLTARRPDGRYVHRETAKGDDPYALLTPVGGDLYYSYRTPRIWIQELGDDAYCRLDENTWQLVSQDDHTATYTTSVADAGGTALLKLTKTFELTAGKPVLLLKIDVENVAGQPLTIRMDQDGPLGIPREGMQYDMRHLMVAQWNDGAARMGRSRTHNELLKAAQKGEPINLARAEHGPVLWTALVNRYFGVYTRPLPDDGPVAKYIAGITGRVADEAATDAHSGDLLARFATKATPIAPGAAADFRFEIYAGIKDRDHLALVNPDYADTTKLYYQLAQTADNRCCCTFLWLRDMMVWLLDTIYKVVRNYGIAIMILVVIVRGLLHPLSVFQQKTMFRTQEAMARLQPKLNELKERYKNDKVKQNQEMMRIYGEEGVNPMGPLVGMLPMFLQMPILIALWTGLNTDVHLRHAPFDGWWIKDLSAPDALIQFAAPIDIPILSMLPLIGGMFKHVPSINLLPLLMGVSMWLQQKYMPKPHMQARLDAAKQQQQAGAATGGMTVEEQLRQQQIMMYMMSIMFPLMFYYMPAGLNLYWMATNVFGIGESLLIRRQLDREKEERAKAGPQAPKKKGLMSRFLSGIATQAEELQRKADEIAKSEEAAKQKKDKKNNNDKRKG